jgi:hypothetical protein
MYNYIVILFERNFMDYLRLIIFTMSLGWLIMTLILSGDPASGWVFAIFWNIVAILELATKKEEIKGINEKDNQ